MVCTKCGQVLPEDSEFCQYCGTSVVIEKEKVEFVSVQEQKLSEEIIIPRKTSKKKVVGVIAIIVSATIIITLAILLLAPWLKYIHAKKLLETGEYSLAYIAFSELEDYSNSREMLKETRYLQAVKHRENGDYEAANDIFVALGSYRDSVMLIHNHDYKVTNKEEPTCKVGGKETYNCVDCGDSYTEHLDAAHKYIVTSGIDATCTATGSMDYECTECGNKYTERIEKKSHSYTYATCTEPRRCTVCGVTAGTALGHTDYLICTVCGVNTFKTLKYTGRGVGNITGINLPAGKYNITLKHSGKSNFIVYFHRDGTNRELIANEIGTTSYVYRLETRYYSTIKNAYINITNADGNWEITIEAVGN